MLRKQIDHEIYLTDIFPMVVVQIISSYAEVRTLLTLDEANEAAVYSTPSYDWRNIPLCVRESKNYPCPILNLACKQHDCNESGVKRYQNELFQMYQRMTDEKMAEEFIPGLDIFTVKLVLQRKQILDGNANVLPERHEHVTFSRSDKLGAVYRAPMIGEQLFSWKNLFQIIGVISHRQKNTDHFIFRTISSVNYEYDYFDKKFVVTVKTEN